MSKRNEFQDDEVYPVKASAGGNNAYYLASCETAGHQPAYCACLNKIAIFEREDALRSDCEGPIRYNTCPAGRMRREEIAAGKAIYFIDRAKLRAFHDELAAAEAGRLASIVGKEGRTVEKRAAPGRQRPIGQTPAGAPPARPQHFLDMQSPGGDYAAAINRAMQQEKIGAPPAPAPSAPPPMARPATAVAEPKPAPAAPVKAGMSLLELARAQMAARA